MSDEYGNDRARLIASFSPKMSEALAYIRSWQLNENNRTLNSRYELGLYIKRIHDEAAASANGGVYGEDVVGRLSKALDEDQTLLRTAMRFVEAYTPEQLKVLCATKCRNGEPIYWSHVRELIRVDDVKVRDAFQKRITTEGITSGELAKLVKDFNDGRKLERVRIKEEETGIPQPKPVTREGIGGPKTPLPITAGQYISKAEKTIERALPSVKALTDETVSLAKMVSTMTAEECTPDVVEKINKVKEAAAEQISYWERIQQDANKASNYAARLLKAQAAKILEEAEEEKSQRPLAPTRPVRKLVASVN